MNWCNVTGTREGTHPPLAAELMQRANPMPSLRVARNAAILGVFAAKSTDGPDLAGARLGPLRAI